jgi:hypothetical protein
MEPDMWTYRGDPKPIYLELAVDFVEPEIRDVKVSEQVSQILSDLQDEGMTGVVERHEILRRYPEYCWMHGWIPTAENHLFEELARHAKRVRPFVKGQRLTAYVIPEKNKQGIELQMTVDKTRKSRAHSAVSIRRVA